MAIAVTNLTDGESSASATSRNTASVSPSAGCIVFVQWNVRAADFATLASETPLVSGAGGTWVQRGTTRLFGGSSQYYCVVFSGTSGSWSAGVLTLGTVAGTRSMDRYQWTVTQVTGHNAAAPIVQIVGASGSAGTLSPSLAAFGGAANFTLLLAGSTGVDDPTWTPEGGYTRLSATGAVNRYSAYIGSNDTSPSVTYTATSALVEGFGLEIADAGGGGGGSGVRQFYGQSRFYSQYAPQSPLERNMAVARYQRERAAEMRRFMARVERNHLRRAA